MLSLASIAVAGVSPPWRPATVRDLHSEYGNIFKHGNRNAASHLWVSFILQRASQLAPSKLEEMFTGFCAVSGSPTRPSDYTRYRLTLPRVDGGGLVSGFMYYCCWPCVCDTQDFIRVDTANVTLAGGEVRRYYWAVVGNPCDDPPKLREPFVQPFYGRGETTLEREAAEVRCDADGRLIGASLSDHGFPIISMFFGAAPATAEQASRAAVAADGSAASAVAAAPIAPEPGRVSRSEDGVSFQDEGEYGPMCREREANGFNSGMGEIFRKVASISPVAISPRLLADAPQTAEQTTEAVEPAGSGAGAAAEAAEEKGSCPQAEVR